MKFTLRSIVLASLATVGFVSSNSADEGKPVAVSVDNFTRAETDTYFARFGREGGFGKLKHDRELANIANQTVIRMNRDTLYSFGVFDLDAAPVAITLPETAKRFLSVLVINQDHYAVDVFYAPGKRTLTKEIVGTRYVCIAIRTFVDPNDPEDLAAVHNLQDTIRVEQAMTGTLELPNWDQSSLGRIRRLLLDLVEANGGLDSARMFGRRDQVDPIQHLLGTAAGWGGNPREAALYTSTTPERNDGVTPYEITLKDVPVNGFWSVSVYDKDGFFKKNEANAYTVNRDSQAQCRRFGPRPVRR